MLKALELVGFKSFADKTRFEFPPGITVVVGPNGSGKSNVVDAIKWVLGEQSVKSLRGKEMVDVIFNGSGGRAPQNSAETTLTFDNHDRLLPIDASEVHITRRVYRSGEGEYLINRQACRLRDIRELLTGTGAGSEAYSIIEQGKVDALLQSSAKDRRAIFEEAAGISRFKAKKVESLRRLERVEQNLLRLADIVEEVENRLKTVRMQATKALRYLELTSRLQELRTQVGQVDWRSLSARLESLESEVVALRDEAGAAAAQCESVEARLLGLDVELGDDAEAMRTCEARLAEHRQRIATAEAEVEHQRGRGRDLENEIARHRRQLAAMTLRAGDLQQQLSDTSAAVREAQQEFEQRSGQLTAAEQQLADMNRQLEELQRQNEQRRSEYLAQMRAVAALGNQIGGLRSQLTSASEACQRGGQQWQQLEEIRRGIVAEVDTLRAGFEKLTEETELQHGHWTQAQADLAALRRRHASKVDELGALRQRHSGLVERSAVLEELEQRQEGLGAGVKEILANARQVRQGPLRQVVGLIAELFRVNVETAPLIDVALGELTGYLVLAPGDEFLTYLEQYGQRLPGRVGFVRLEAASSTSGEEIDYSDQPGVLGRADRFVETVAEHRPLARRLLGRTWVVERLEHSYALLARGDQAAQFVTLAGELLTADGVLVVGPRVAAAGLISRRSELRALQAEITELAGEIRSAEAEVARSQSDIDRQEQQVLALSNEFQQAGGALAEQRLRLEAAEKRQTELDRQSDAVRAELEAARGQQRDASESLARAEAQLADSERQLGEMESAIAAAGQLVIELDQRRQEQSRAATSQKVELAKQEERLQSLRARHKQLENDQHERQRAIVDTQAELVHCHERIRQSERVMLQAASEIAELYLKKEAIAAETIAHLARRDARQAERGELAQQAQKGRTSVRKLEEQLHAKELSAGEIRLQRSTLAGRLRDDYGIELAEQVTASDEPTWTNRDEVDQEIAELRRKVNNIGSVNLDALEELDELERRFQTLSTQYKDLSDAKNSLEQIIHKINADSRRLFVETRENVRGHFQTLFRKLFGGGQADIVLEEGVDVLESGIDIIARPPGKEPRNISLLSGGEKTLTCVAMLLAIFKSRPSPFCVLDEVDAALDEANIERFVGVLKEFLTWTQFVVVTHSKKTMACANTLYGVTMQESGISKRVAVRFEDVSDNGEIRGAADRADEEAA
jgi:chromosome segregation protein